jgi:hypothetical protein
MSAGCRSVGPRTVDSDRVNYSTAITESWKRQTLLNIVKLRYADLPIFVDIGQIVAGYTLETALSASGIDLDGNLDSATTLSLGASGRFIDRPTITYVPLTGDSFMSGLITPIPPVSLFAAIESGWPADDIARIGMAAINGIGNERFQAGVHTPADPEFARIVELLGSLQRSGALSLRRVETSARSPSILVLRNDERLVGAAQLIEELRLLLGLDRGVTEFDLVYGSAARNGSEIAVQSRSLLNVLQLMAAQTTVPEQHIAEGRTSTGFEGEESLSLQGFRIHSSESRPSLDYASVNYRDTWFYISDTDMTSKRVFSLIMLLFTLADTSSSRAEPVLTIPTQ